MISIKRTAAKHRSQFYTLFCSLGILALIHGISACALTIKYVENVNLEFTPDQTELTTWQRERLARLANSPATYCAKAADPGLVVTIEALQTPKLPSDEFNLAEARAKNVKLALVQEGIPKEFIFAGTNSVAAPAERNANAPTYSVDFVQIQLVCDPR